MLGHDETVHIDIILESIGKCKLSNSDEVKILKQFKIDFAGHSDYGIKQALNKKIVRLSRKVTKDQFQVNKQSKGYKDGYLNGFKWKYDYIPGGPWVYTATHNHSNDEKFKQMSVDSLNNYKNWHAGFRDGLKLNKHKSDKLK